MQGVPQPSDEPYQEGDEVQVYLGPNDPDGLHHGKSGTVMDVLQDNLGAETERELDSYLYKVEVDGQEIDIWYRHRDLVPETG